MHLLNVLSLSITIIHSWNRKTSLFMFAMISEWGRSFNNLFIMLFKRSCMYLLHFLQAEVLYDEEKLKIQWEGKNVISFFHFTCHNIPRITTVSCWVLTLWKLLFCTCNILCFRCTNWVCFWIVSLQCYPPCLRLWLTRCTFTDTRHFPGARGEVCGPVIPSSKKPNLT